jgi:hypothetical protein
MHGCERVSKKIQTSMRVLSTYTAGVGKDKSTESLKSLELSISLDR